MIDVDAYIRALDLPKPGEDTTFGGQELILGECVGALAPYDVWFPLPYYCETLVGRCCSTHIDHAQAVYFGTPTIMNDAPLFDVREGETWTKEAERQVVRNIVMWAEQRGYKRIVSGLGTGDISTAERLSDMGGGEVVCWKKFNGFEDWVLVRDL